VLAYLKSANLLYLESWNLILFLAGISIGKFIILCLYCYLSAFIKKHTTNLKDYISKVIGGILLVAGLIQAVKGTSINSFWGSTTNLMANLKSRLNNRVLYFKTLKRTPPFFNYTTNPTVNKTTNCTNGHEFICVIGEIRGFFF
jgi:hypothetical protein